MAGVLGYKKATDAPPITPQDLWLVIDAWTTLSGVRSCEEFLWELEESDIRNSVEVHKRISTLPVKAFRWCDSPLYFHQSSGQELLPSWLCTHTHQSQAQLCTKCLSLPLNKDLRKSLSLSSNVLICSTIFWWGISIAIYIFVIMKMYCRWWSRSTDSLEKRSQHIEVPEPNLWEAGC